MKKTMTFIIVILLLFNLQGFGQNEEPKFGISFSGFVKSDLFWDSRQTVAAREGHFLLWPQPVLNDNAGDDVNAVSNFNFLAVQSRLTGKITGPDAFGAKTSGVIEGDFFAQANDNINLFRLRHAFVKLNWENTELLTGQYWNPLFVTGCFPGTVSFNSGTPLQSFARNPQLRITQKIGGLSIVAAALSQRDYATRGVNGPSSEYLRNSAVPDMHFQLHYGSTNETSGTGFLLGSGIAYKSIVPRLTSETGQKVDESVTGLTAIAFTKITLSPITLKLQGRYGENIADVLSISGFAVRNLPGENQTYTPLKNMTVWGEIHTNGKKFQAGVFGGYLKSLGTKHEMANDSNPVYGLGQNIASLLKVSPRMVFISNKTKFAAELEYTVAEYGGDFDTFYIPESTTSASNIRLLLSVIYAF